MKSEKKKRKRKKKEKKKKKIQIKQNLFKFLFICPLSFPSSFPPPSWEHQGRMFPRTAVRVRELFLEWRSSGAAVRTAPCAVRPASRTPLAGHDDQHGQDPQSCYQLCKLNCKKIKIIWQKSVGKKIGEKMKKGLMNGNEIWRWILPPFFFSSTSRSCSIAWFTVIKRGGS